MREALESITADRWMKLLRISDSPIGCSSFLTLTSLCSFLTKRNRQICADPKETWVQEYITDLELNA